MGVLALIIDFGPGLRLPDSASADGWRPIETKLGLDLSGGLRVEYQAVPVEGKSPSAGDMSVIKDIVERRVNQTGVSEPVVVTQGSDRVVVELPGVTDFRNRSASSSARRAGSTSSHSGRPRCRPARSSTSSNIRPSSAGIRVSSATVGTDQNGRPSVDFVLKPDGADKFAEYTAQNVGSYFAIALDSSVISAPVIQSSIPNGNVQITGGGLGGFSTKDASNLVTVLKFGSLPFPIQELSTEQISATLGSQFLNQSLWPARSGSCSSSSSWSSTTG